MSYKSVLAVAGIAAVFAVGVFAQRVGDVVQVEGQSYRVEEARNGRLVLQEVRGHDRGNRRERGSRYEVVNQSLSWTDAKREAERRGGYLAVITSDEEQREIERMVRRDGNKNFYWLGGQRTGNQWGWITGESFQYTNWGDRQPDNYRGQDKLMMMRISNAGIRNSTLGQWDDCADDGRLPNEAYFAADQKGFVIEYD